jgi:hypothetical protein
MGGAAIPSIVAPPHPPVHHFVRVLAALLYQEGMMAVGVGASEFNLENLRERLQRMSDEELTQFGKACRDMLTPQANLGRPPREVFVIQLQEAREEWRKQYPKNG